MCVFTRVFRDFTTCHHLFRVATYVVLSFFVLVCGVSVVFHVCCVSVILLNLQPNVIWEAVSRILTGYRLCCWCVNVCMSVVHVCVCVRLFVCGSLHDFGFCVVCGCACFFLCVWVSISFLLCSHHL